MVTVAAGVKLQLKPAHPTRWGHREAGRWLAAHAGPGEAVLDTRGWAAFVSGLPSYDYWHVRQAFTDAHLAYVVVGDDELQAAQPPRGDAAGGARVLGDAGRRVPREEGRARGRRPGLSLREARESGRGCSHDRPDAVDTRGFWGRLLRGSRWTWLDDRYRAALPADLDETVMALESRDRLHAKQGRSTARVVFHGPSGPVSVYLKRHFRLPWPARLAALVEPPRPSHAGRRRVRAPEPGPRARAGRPRGGRGRRTDRPVGPFAKLPDGRRADRLAPPSRGDPRARRAARPPRLRAIEARPGAGDGRDPRRPCTAPGSFTRTFTSATTSSTCTGSTSPAVDSP